MIRVKCPACGRVYDLGDDLAGKKIECECGCKFYLTGPAAAPQPAPLSVPPPPAAAPPSENSAPSDKSDPAAPAVHYSRPSGPGEFWPAAVIRGECLLLIIGGGVFASLAGGMSNPRLALVSGLIALGVGAVLLAPALCFAAMADRLHRLEWYAQRLEWYTRRDYEERHPQPPKGKK